MAFIIAVSNLLSHVFNLQNLTWEKGKGQPASAFGRVHFPTQELIKQKDTPVKMSVQRSEYFRRILLTVFLILVENSNSFSSVPCTACILQKMWVQLPICTVFLSIKKKKIHPQLICMGNLRSQIVLTLSLTRPHPTAVHSALLLSFLPILDNKAQKDRFMFYSSVGHHQPAQVLTSNTVNKCLLH